jgi:hypothetical protein
VGWRRVGCVIRCRRHNPHSGIVRENQRGAGRPIRQPGTPGARGMPPGFRGRLACAAGSSRHARHTWAARPGVESERLTRPVNRKQRDHRRQHSSQARRPNW